MGRDGARWVLVTGASTGIGEACVGELVGAGARVFAGVRRVVDGERLVGALGGRVTPVILDVTDAEQISGAVARVAEATGEGGLDALVNNAGIVVAGPLEYLPVEEVRRQMEVNVTAQVAVTQAFLPLLRRARGRVVFMGSSSGRFAAPFVGPYAASKFALEAIADAWRVELHGAGVGVSIVEPGAVLTPIWEKSKAEAEALNARMPAACEAHYGAALDRLRAHVDATPGRAIPAARVAAAVRHAVYAGRPRTRYLVGMDAWMQAMVIQRLPDRLRDWLIARFLQL